MKCQVEHITVKNEDKNMNPTIKIKFISRKEKFITNNIDNSNISFDIKETTKKTDLKYEEKDTNLNTNIISQEINQDFPDKLEENTLDSILIPSYPSTCVTKGSYLDELILSSTNVATLCTNNSQNLNSNVATQSPLFPDIEYSPVPEKEYYDDILQELLIEEKKLEEYKNSLCIKYQEYLDNKNRALLICFVYKMAKFFKFKNRTIFLCVQTMDRFLCKEKIDQYYFLLMCMCTLVIASKFNEIYYPAYKDIIRLFGRGYDYKVEQALKMETLILKSIDYNLLPNYPMYFFDIITQKTSLTEIEYFLGNLMMELIQFDFYLYPIKNSIIAQTVFGKVVNLTRGKSFDSLAVLKSIFPEENFESNSKTISLIKTTSIAINELLHNLNSDYFIDIYEKYRHPEILGESIDYFLKN
jgi:hypothetical protein